ncbi:MAG: hypothetical protein COX19_08845 [Desulfobacterales bacterium CG23_combo_of_CG06-09_8_20_14_all_51_8]|nr:MAG: hypothetical protein COX19_08845 [Desulfobacterales bacterium CG23_combo_of_CG06-09_8_20_14_all_51_8]
MKILKFLNESFEKQMVMYWSNLSRSTNLFVIMNISLFFLTEMVTKNGYYFTFYSLGLLLIVKVGLLVPFGLLNRLWFYCVFLVAELFAVYFLVSSIWYWVVHNKI